MKRQARSNWLESRFRNLSNNVSKLFNKDEEDKEPLHPQPLRFLTPYGDKEEKTVQWAPTKLTDFSRRYSNIEGPPTSRVSSPIRQYRPFVLYDQDDKESDSSSDLFGLRGPENTEIKTALQPNISPNMPREHWGANNHSPFIY